MFQTAILMGSDSDWPVVKKAADTLDKFGVAYDVNIISAHRTPDMLRDYVRKAEAEGVRVFIGAAGMAAHLPGVIASLTTRPVIGIPIKSGALDGMDALLAIAQMPPGIPVATVTIDGAVNAALLAVQILAAGDSELAGKMKKYREDMGKALNDKNLAFREGIKCENK